MNRLLFFLVLLFVGCTGLSSRPSADNAPPHIRQVPAEPDGLPVITDPVPDAVLEHDDSAFTQGLLFHDGKLYESTGQKGQSQIRRLKTEDGELEAKTPLDDEFFGEGLAYFEDHFYQITWQDGVCLVYNSSLELQKTLYYGTEGWGLTLDPDKKQFVFSDGSDQLRYLNPANLITTIKLSVTDGKGKPVRMLNELEWVQGEIWANLWMSDSICRIDPKTGKALGWIKLQQITRDNQSRDDDVLNGIAYDPLSDTLWITGKYWPKMYRFDKVKERFFKES